MTDRLPERGAKGKLCNRTACHNLGAIFWNCSTRKYYCHECAQGINYWSLRDSGFNICVVGQGEPSYNELEGKK